ncbi:GTPase Era [Varibaculum cambriense]|uniref:GTPase Era n=1 Tax=Varibaculum cambriense TaxID=184870 RepID=UPI00255332DA|nr:GTPase Era [Varibaculum cambriense]MDK8274900.1 GTPase Era [Varibaculum cambriense]
MSEQEIKSPSEHRAGFVSIVGRPNVGKSTLTNALVGQKVAITSSRPETTRHNVRGVVQGEDYQLVLVDTPGLHRPRTLLGKRLNDMVREALVDVDAVVFCVPADQKIGPGDRYIAAELKELKLPVILAVTKADLVSKERMVAALVDAGELGDWKEIVPVSAKQGEVSVLADQIAKYLPPSPPLYPRDQVSDESVEKLIAEFVREAALEGVREELPHSIAVQVEEILYQGEDSGPQLGYGTHRAPEKDKDTEESAQDEAGSESGISPSATTVEGEAASPQKETKPLDVHVNVFVERDSQKGILIGKGGSHIRRVRIKSKRQIQRLLGQPVQLHLHVRVAKNWQSDTKMLGRLGF